jgi:ComF family protein
MSLTKVIKFVRSLVFVPKKVSFHFIPGVCITCGAPSQRLIDLCRACEDDLPWLGSACAICSLPLHNSETIDADTLQLVTDSVCTNCLKQKPLYTKALCPFLYDFPIDKMIHRFKNQQQFVFGTVLAQLMHRAVICYFAQRQDDASRRKVTATTRSADHQGSFTLVPVPLHKSKFRQRGFNQSEYIARIIGKQTGIRVRNDLIKRTVQRSNQKQLALKERTTNVKNAFAITQTLDRQRIILVDDVITTSATITEITRVLIEAGAIEVVILAIARTPSTTA